MKKEDLDEFEKDLDKLFINWTDQENPLAFEEYCRLYYLREQNVILERLD